MIRNHLERLGLVRRRPRPFILMYHRVASPACDPWGLAVSPENFALHLQQLKDRHTVMPMEELVQCLARGRLPADAAAITFDDGYLDNLAQAAPLLAQASLPATLFLSTGPSMRGQAYWYDELAAMVLDQADPVDIAIALPDGPLAIRLPQREAADTDRRGWRAWHEPRSAREAAYFSVWKRLRAVPPGEQREAIAKLRDLLPADPVDSRPMDSADLQALVSTGAFTLGGHTSDHPDLPTLTRSEAREQIVRGKAEIEALGLQAVGFAYPYGSYSDEVAELVREAGFGWACTTDPDHLRRRGADLLRLPRFAAPDQPQLSIGY